MAFDALASAILIVHPPLTYGAGRAVKRLHLAQTAHCVCRHRQLWKSDPTDSLACRAAAEEIVLRKNRRSQAKTPEENSIRVKDKHEFKRIGSADSHNTSNCIALVASPPVVHESLEVSGRRGRRGDLRQRDISNPIRLVKGFDANACE